jgi:hypothetical protein
MKNFSFLRRKAPRGSQALVVELILGGFFWPPFLLVALCFAEGLSKRKIRRFTLVLVLAGMLGGAFTQKTSGDG